MSHGEEKAKRWEALRTQGWFQAAVVGLSAVVPGAIWWGVYGREFGLGVVAFGIVALSTAAILLLHRYRPRFSVRTLAIFVALVCAYFGAWEATNRYAVFPLSQKMANSYGGPMYSTPIPFVIRRTTTPYGTHHTYRVWLPWKANPFNSV